jgi:hypothetical protein
MELFLNLCWLALLVPAYLLWRRRVSSGPWTRASFAIICTLGCALVMLFPIISASDDLHAVGQAMEESKRSFLHDANCSCSLHPSLGAFSSAVPVSGSLTVIFERVGTVIAFAPASFESVLANLSAGRSPPLMPVTL